MTAPVGENRAVVLHGPGDVRVEERAVPEPAAREVLVEIAAVGVCGSDVHYYEHGRIGSFVVREPMVLGHESSGRIVALGPGASKHAVGDRVALEPGVPCGNCRECRAGRYNLCRDVRFFATPPIDGAFANYVTIHEDFAFALPESVSDEAGALMEPLSVGVWACQKANVSAGDRVLVTGAGPIGLLAAQCARAFGATEITVTDVNVHRLKLAQRTGATRTINVADVPLEDSGVEADALIECSGHPASLKAGIAALRPAGTAVLVGMGPEEEGVVPLSLIQNRELWLTGTFRYANTYPTAIALAANGRVDLEAIITGHYGLDQAENALRAGREDPTAVKVMVMPAFPARSTG
jgi:L-iditol 2-dehydrogenase